MQVQRHLPKIAIVSLLAVLPAFTNFKLGSLQPEDLLLLSLLGFCIAKFLSSGFSFKISSNLQGLLKSYSFLLLLLFLLGALAIRLPFYPLSEMGFLKRPVIFSLSKLLQLTAIIGGFFWLTNVFLENESYLDKALNLYWYTGLVSSWYALAFCLLLRITHADITSQSLIAGAYNNFSTPRARGFFNEGGPYGIYLLSVFMVGLLRRYRMHRKLGTLNVVILLAAFMLSGSKAGFFVAVFLAFYWMLSAQTFRRKVMYLTLSAAILCGAAVWMDLGGLLLGYVNNYQNIEEAMALRGMDTNLVMGRVAAAYIVPRMIAYHPITGIGFGNYPLMRNDPHYLGSLPTITSDEDLPALGIPGIAAEMGIPLTLLLVFLLFAPYWVSRKKVAVIATAGLFQGLATTFGVQLTFAYPWFVSACVLAMSCQKAPEDWE